MHNACMLLWSCPQTRRDIGRRRTCVLTLRASQPTELLLDDQGKLERAWAAATRADSGIRCVTGLCRRPAQYSASHRSRSSQKAPMPMTPYLMCCVWRVRGQGQGQVRVSVMLAVSSNLFHFQPDSAR